MKKFKTTNTGGLPIVLDDLRWIESAYQQAFFGILSGFGIGATETFILSGCTRSVAGGIVTVAEGYICIGGEVCYLPVQTYPTTTDTEYFVINETYDSAGLKLFQSGASHDTYQVRNASVTVSASPPTGHTTVQGALTIFEVIQSKLTNIAKRYEVSGWPFVFPAGLQKGDIVVWNDEITYIYTQDGFIEITY